MHSTLTALTATSLGAVHPGSRRCHGARPRRASAAQQREDDHPSQAMPRGAPPFAIRRSTPRWGNALGRQRRTAHRLQASTEAVTQGRYSPPLRLAGALNGALDRLLKQGVIRIKREEVVDGRPRRRREPGSYGRAPCSASRLKAQEC
ncbi:hypothetical protein GCM10009753_50930 [Streptantibioticus ferralitis]